MSVTLDLAEGRMPTTTGSSDRGHFAPARQLLARAPRAVCSTTTSMDADRGLACGRAPNHPRREERRDHQDSMLVGRQLQQVVAACEMDGATENYYLPCFFKLINNKYRWSDRKLLPPLFFYFYLSPTN
jgi:hypothetical protein